MVTLMKKTLVCLLLCFLSAGMLCALSEKKIIDSMENLVFSVDFRKADVSVKCSGFYVHRNGVAFTSEAPVFSVEDEKADLTDFSVFVKSVNISKRRVDPGTTDAGFLLLDVPELKKGKAVPISKTALEEGQSVLIVGYSPNKHSLIINHNTIAQKQESMWTLEKPVDSFLTGGPVLNLKGEIAGFMFIADEDDLSLNLVSDISGMGAILKSAIEDYDKDSDNTERLLYPEGGDDHGEVTVTEVKKDGYTFTLANRNLLKVEGKGNTVRVPDTVNYICDRAFEGVNTKEIVLPSSVEEIEIGAFYDCLTEKYSVSKTNNYFVGTEGVLCTKQDLLLVSYPAAKKDDSYVIPRGIEGICDFAFYDCKYLRSLTAPITLKNIGENCILDKLGKLTIYGMEDSVLQYYADDHDINFRPRSLTESEIKFLRDLQESLAGPPNEA